MRLPRITASKHCPERKLENVLLDNLPTLTIYFAVFSGRKATNTFLTCTDNLSFCNNAFSAKTKPNPKLTTTCTAFEMTLTVEFSILVALSCKNDINPPLILSQSKVI